MVLTQVYRFRWTACQLEALKNSFPAVIRRSLDDLPKSLDETYDRILLNIAQERQEYAQRLFQCLAMSFRSLRVEELAEILAIRFEVGSSPNYNVNWRPENPEEAVLSACSSLITIVDSGDFRVVQFSHFSVKEYLTSERLANAGNHLSKYHIVPYQAHTTLAQASLSVLLALDEPVDKDNVKNFPLTIYSARYWVEHAQFDNVSSNLKDAMERIFDSTKPHFATWVWIYDIDYPFREIMSAPRPTPPEAVPFYYATLCGFRGLVEHLIDTCPQDINARGGYYHTPLHAAIVKGNVDVTAFLLAHGADVAVVNDHQLTPMHEATRRANLDIVELLLDHHTDVDIHDGRGNTPLSLASFEGDLDVAQALLRHGASVDSRNHHAMTPLMFASRNGHLDIVRLLVLRGAAINSRNGDSKTARLWTPVTTAVSLH